MYKTNPDSSLECVRFNFRYHSDVPRHLLYADIWWKLIRVPQLSNVHRYYLQPAAWQVQLPPICADQHGPWSCLFFRVQHHGELDLNEYVHINIG